MVCIVIIDIDECSTGDHNCTQNQQCVNMPGTLICECVSGYELLNGNCEGKYYLNPTTSRLSLLLHKSEAKLRTSVNNNDNLRV